MKRLPPGTLVTMRETYQFGYVVRTRNAAMFLYDIALEDGTIIKATSDFWHSVPSVMLPICAIPDCVSVETGKPVGDLPGFAFIDFYHFQKGEIELCWKVYRELYPLDPLLIMWNYASSPTGLLNERERARYDTFTEHMRRVVSAGRTEREEEEECSHEPALPLF